MQKGKQIIFYITLTKCLTFTTNKHKTIEVGFDWDHSRCSLWNYRQQKAITAAAKSFFFEVE